MYIQIDNNSNKKVIFEHFKNFLGLWSLTIYALIYMFNLISGKNADIHINQKYL